MLHDLLDDRFQEIDSYDSGALLVDRIDDILANSLSVICLAGREPPHPVDRKVGELSTSRHRVTNQPHHVAVFQIADTTILVRLGKNVPVLFATFLQMLRAGKDEKDG